MGDILEMSHKELTRLEVAKKVINNELKQVEASKQLGLSYRQIKRLVRRYKADGTKGLLSRHRKKSSNRKFTEDFKRQVKTAVTNDYHDFGPTFAAEKLEDRDALKVSRETLRHWMTEWELWKPKKRKTITVHQQRERRPCFGELVQIDGSPHDWFEGRSEKCCLIAFIDDATSKAIQLCFFPVENTNAYFECVKRHLKQYGRPLSYYSDRHSIFRVNQKGAIGETQFERAMKELGIETINANSPQAKGRVERHNRTLQDRLVKEMRLHRISDIGTANVFLEEYIEEYNKKFGKPPANTTDMHKQTIPSDAVLNVILSKRYTRKLTKNLEFSFKNETYQITINKGRIGYGLRNARVDICQDKDEVITVWFRNRQLDYRKFLKEKTTSPIVSSKEINHEVELIKSRGMTKPDINHPWKRNSFLQMLARRAG